MSVAALDPVAAVLSAGEGRFEWTEGSLIEMGQPSEEHEDTGSFLTSVMRTYAEAKKAGRAMGDGFIERLNAETVRVPDVAFFKKDNVGKIKRTYSEGGADLVIEIVSPDSKGRDRGDKFYDYEKAGIEEYWIVDPDRRSAEFYRLTKGLYAQVMPDAEGKVHSSALSGFFIRVEWLWNRPEVLDALRELGLI